MNALARETRWGIAEAEYLQADHSYCGPVLYRVYCEWKITMAVENLADVIGSLTPEEQESVRVFIEFLRRRNSRPSSPFLAAVDEFIDQHPELLRHLAQ